MDPTFRAPTGIGGEFTPPPDKSITHRALMLGAVSDGSCRILNPLRTGDCISTRVCLEALGCSFHDGQNEVAAQGVGLRGLQEPRGMLDAENSGTTMRLLSGLLAGQPLFAVLTGDESLRGRPMGRVVEPLRGMGARIEGRSQGRFAPLCFLPGTGTLAAIDYELPVPSAQVKSAILLAALRAESPTRLRGLTGSRDHTERMLRALGIDLTAEGGLITMAPARSGIPGFSIDVPGDVSSSAFMVAASLVSSREVLVRGCGVNPTRCGFLSVVKRMGAHVEISVERTSLGEPMGTIRVTPGELRGTRVAADEVPDLIDEVPLLAVLGLAANGLTEVRGAAELKHKESDRLGMIAAMVSSLGGRIEIFEDGFAVEGPQRLSSGSVDPKGDHRIAMAAAVAGVGTPAGVRVRGFECARVSYPDFNRDFTSLGGEIS